MGVEERMDAEATKEQIGKWLEVPEFWDIYELLPAMGMAGIAPFGKVLRSEGKMVPYLFHLSPESGLGKTEVLRIYSNLLFGRTLENSDSIGSQYRLADVFDSFGGLIGVEEGDDFKWRKFSAAL